MDWVVFADYSGARSASEQRKRIALAIDDGRGEIRVSGGMTRGELLDRVLVLLEEAERMGQRVLLGFDHNYGFPVGFHEALHGELPADWRAVLEGFVLTVWGPGGWSRRKLADWPVRDWARESNEHIGLALGTGAGPFYGTQFARYPGPELYGHYRLPDGREFRLYERRLAEERLRRLKPPYQIGGIGTVGQQSLYGMLHLYGLLEACRERGISLHVWPMDGTKVPEGSHVLAEMYPSMHHRPEDGPRTDAGDAQACVRWVRQEERAGRLEHWLTPSFRAEEWERVRLEGWVLGLMP